MRERIRKETEVTRDKRFQAEEHLRERGENQQREEKSKARGREKFFGEVIVAGWLHAQIKTGGGGKCNRGAIRNFLPLLPERRRGPG
jgi:hypothetical protein